jgi:hypothetical protein
MPEIFILATPELRINHTPVRVLKVSMILVRAVRATRPGPSCHGA